MKTINSPLLPIVFLSLFFSAHASAIDQSPWRDTDRLAISADGNAQAMVLRENVVLDPLGNFRDVGDTFSSDADDVPAIPISLAIIQKAAMRNKLVHLNYNNSFAGRRNAETIRPNRMKIAIDDVSRALGFRDGIIFDAQANKNRAVNHLRTQINRSTPDSKLYIMLAGPAEIVYRALRRANPTQRAFVYIISHNSFNDNTKLLTRHKIVADILADFPEVNFKRITDQNIRLNTKGSFSFQQLGQRSSPAYNPWRWMDDNSQSELDTIFESMVSVRTPDISDAGLVWWTLKLHRNNAANDGNTSTYATPNILRTFFQR